MNEPIANTTDRDIQPLDAGEPEMLAPPQGGATAESKKPKPKGLMERISDLISGDEGIARMQQEKEQSAIAEEQRQADLDMQIAQKESQMAAEARAKDPALIAQQKAQISIIKSRHNEAKRLLALNRIITESLRRKSIPDSDPDIDFYEAQIDRESLWGVFSKGKDK